MNDSKEHLIIPYLLDKLSPETRKEFESWRNESDENRRKADDFQHIWKLTAGSQTAPDFASEEEWKKLASSIAAQPEAPVRKLNVPAPYWLKIAAAILLLLLSSGVVYLTVVKDDRVNIQTTDNIFHTVLPDGSEIWLNKGSSLTYGSDFTNNRFVDLRGEGFFDIKRDAAHPFIIHTEDAQVKVMGTSFNVKAYDTESETEVFVLTGKVSLATGDLSENIILTPGVTGILNRKDHRLISETQEDHNSLGWKNKQLAFKKTPLRKVVKALRSYFRKDIQVANEALLDCRITAYFTDQPLDEVLEVLSLALDMQIKIEQGVYILDGAGCKEN
jgi:ferric-dicitrate binding protein FerR (iron transport regulator)